MTPFGFTRTKVRLFPAEHQERAPRQGMSSLRNWSKAENSQDGSSTQLCPRCGSSYLTSQALCRAWSGSLNRPWSQGNFFSPQNLMQILETIQGEYSSACPCHVRFRHPPQGSSGLWTLFLWQYLTTTQKCLNQEEKVFQLCSSLQHFLLVSKWGQVWIISMS